MTNPGKVRRGGIRNTGEKTDTGIEADNDFDLRQPLTATAATTPRPRPVRGFFLVLILHF